MLEQIVEYMSYPFVVNALVAGVLIALCAALLGVPLVLRRLSFIGDGLSHVAFGAMAVATALSFADSMVLSLPVTIACSLLLLRSRRGNAASGDAVLAMLSVGAMAAGYLIMNLKPSSSNVSGDVCTTLFGSVSILTLTTLDLDFTEMNQTVQAAYLYKLAARPEEFEGKSLRLPGRFTTTVGEKDGKRYFGCLVGNVEGGCPCCTQTLLFEFEPKEAELWRTNFPPENTFITVTGRLKMISETSYGQSYDIPRLMDSDVVVRR